MGQFQDRRKSFRPYAVTTTNQIQRRRILVTGGAGFLGSNLCDLLIRQGHEVICLDNLQTGRYINIAHLESSKRFWFLNRDVIDPIPELPRIDEIYNLACPASPPKYQLDPIHTFKTSVLGAMNLLEFARLHDAKILQSSTSEVYGDPEISSQPESYRGNVNTMGPRACYDESKRAAETLFFDYHVTYGVRTRVARIFNTYGPNMSPTDGRVISNFVVQALRGEDISIYGDGSQTRSFCYVSDMIRGLMALMAAPDDDVVHPVNLGNPSEFTIARLARQVLEQTGSRSRLVHCDLPVDDPRRRKPDISRAKTLLNWEPEVQLEEGLNRAIPYFAELLDSVAHQTAAQ